MDKKSRFLNNMICKTQKIASGKKGELKMETEENHIY